MTKAILRATMVLPLLGMLIPMLVGFFVPGYSSIQQHMSELELLSPDIAMSCRVGAVIAGGSIMAFAVALLLQGGSRYAFTALTAVIFGVSMVSNGIFTMGSPLHGLYAIGLSVILCPAFFAAERGKGRDVVSLIAAFLVLVYMWALMTGLDPAATKGLTQRLTTLPMFGWFGYASWLVLRDGLAKRPA
ncbi:DUF998 domain-containing protein [Luteibacter aegosomaticola]|uniref:DUF998 domain-containing protein n=1 Tax=Luteibacter aegosomaticola TaxID=2911538 RepID=UPI001FFBFB41|nr:DUF998 domain-containing protein [Luteibacter aegosomaticola]UPG89469.1 DUF998 domain-containing protein [Luteibacter aegosomaticola]